MNCMRRQTKTSNRTRFAITLIAVVFAIAASASRAMPRFPRQQLFTHFRAAPPTSTFHGVRRLKARTATSTAPASPVLLTARAAYSSSLLPASRL